MYKQINSDFRTSTVPGLSSTEGHGGTARAISFLLCMNGLEKPSSLVGPANKFSQSVCMAQRAVTIES